MTQLTFGLIALVCTVAVYGAEHTRVKRGNFGERYSGGLGAGSSHGVGYGGSTSLGSHSGGGGGGVIFDTIAQKAVSVPNDQFLAQHQAQLNAGASSSSALNLLQQHGFQSAAQAGAQANQYAQWYNQIATGPVPAGYKGEYRRRR